MVGRVVVGVEVAGMVVVEPPVGRVPPVDGAKSSSPPIVFGRLESRMTLSRGARSRPLASGSCLLDVRFFRIAMFYPVFFTCEVKPAIFVIGVRLAALVNFVGGAPVVGFFVGCAF